MKGGRELRDVSAVELARAVEDLGAGEILLNCIDNDGQGNVMLSSLELFRPVLSSGIRSGTGPSGLQRRDYSCHRQQWCRETRAFYRGKTRRYPRPVH